jgi:hypothetical protein
MVNFDIRLKMDRESNDIASFEPDIASLVCFGMEPQRNLNEWQKSGQALQKEYEKGTQLYMRLKT